MTFTVGLPQLIFIILTVFGLGIYAIKHGEPRTDRYNFYTQLVAELLVIGLLYWGGFFGGH